MSDASRVRSIVDEARRRKGDNRAAFLRNECGDDAALRSQVEALLRADEAAGNAPTAGPTSDSAADDFESATSISEQAGSSIGPYRLLKRIGEGGFGTVFMAEQLRPVQRTVALKIIKLGMDTRQVVARFEQERQALALMDHPSIAKVFDAGATATGRPYFVMELCTGEPITDYCDRHNLPIAARLALFVQVCQAVQHAHQKGLIHRDIKPSNVLVSDGDNGPAVKVIDFGIAKATAAKLTEKTVFTEQRQMIGTPQYMSPEQAEGSLDIDTRTDVYALGVLLYELLTGVTPFDGKRLRSAAYAEIQRIIRDVEPPKPSTRLSENTDGLASVSANRHTEPRTLGSIIRGELDWIVMKALEKDRQRRYDTANGLGLDIQRYLAGDVVIAAPPSRSYRVKKFVKRNKGPVIAASLLTLALVGGLIGTTYGLRQAVKAREAESLQRQAAENERDQNRTIAEFMSGTLNGVGPSVAIGRDTTLLKEMMDSAVAQITKGVLKKNPDAEVRLRNTVGGVYTELARFDEAAKVLEPCVAIARAAHPGDSSRTAESLAQMGYLFLRHGDLAGAEPLYREALAMQRRIFHGDNVDLATSMNATAYLLQEKGDLAGAEPLYREALDMRRRLKPGDSSDVAISLNSLSRLYRVRGQQAEAERLLRESLAMQRRLFPGDHPDLAVDLQNLANILQDKGDLAGAEALSREAIEMMKRLYKGDNPQLASSVAKLATLLRLRGDLAGAETFARDALAMKRRLFPGDNRDVVNSCNALATILQQRGDLAGAETLFRECLAVNNRLYPGDHPNRFSDLNNLAFILLSRGDYASAEQFARDGLAMSLRLNGKDSFLTGNIRLRLGLALTGLTRFAEAETELIESERVLSTASGVPPGRYKQCVEAIERLYEAWDKAEPGAGHGAKAVEWKAKLDATPRPTTSLATTRAAS